MSDTFMRDKIAALHGEPVLKRSALNIRGGAGVFEWAMAGKGYGTALEIGTYRGCASAEMGRHCEKVITIDLVNGQLERAGENWDRRKFWKSLGIDNIAFYPVADDAEKAALVNRLTFDFAFIDGAHDGRVAGDFAMVKRCGKVLFHDADDNTLRLDKTHKPNHVYEFISTLPRHQVEARDIFALWQNVDG